MTKNLNAEGPEWLRVAVSRAWYNFSKSWLNFTHNTKEMVESGRIDPSKQVILVLGPHGQYTVGALCFYSHWVAKGWPWKNMHAVIADVLFKAPIVADYLCLVNSKPATEKNMDGLLAQGHTVAMYAGGVHEQIRTDENKETLYFAGKLSFVRLAIKRGVDLVPLYTFGENQLWPTSEPFTSFNTQVYNKTGVGNILLHSPILKLPTSILLPSPMLLPRFKQPIHGRLGDQVRVGPPDDNPSMEKVMEVFGRYVDVLMRLFNEHKSSCLPPEVAARGLTVVLRATRESKERTWHSHQLAPRSSL